MYGGEGADSGATANMFSVNTTTGTRHRDRRDRRRLETGPLRTVIRLPTVVPPPPLDGTTTSLQASPLSSVYGQSITLSVAVSPAAVSSGTPTGSVTFYDGTINLGSSPLNGETASWRSTTCRSGWVRSQPRTAATPASNRARPRLWT